MQHRAPTTPLQITLFCKHLPATQPTHLSAGTLGTFVQPVLHSTAGRHKNLGSLAFNLGCCEKQTLRMPVRMLHRMHRPRFCSFSTRSRTPATRFIYSKNTQRFNSVHHSDHRPLWLQSFRPSSVYTAQYMVCSRDCRLIHNVNYNLHSLQLTSQMFVFQYVSLLYCGYRVSRVTRPGRGVDYPTAPSAEVEEYSLLPIRLLIPLHVNHTIPYLYIQPSSWRWGPSGSKHVEDTKN